MSFIASFCNFCGGKVEFESENIGGEKAIVGCPHCQKMIPLINPNWVKVSTPPVLTNTNSCSKVVAALFAIFLGAFGIHKFYMGKTNWGIAYLLTSTIGGCITCGMATMAVGVVGLVEGIIFLSASDADFQTKYVQSPPKSWL